MKHGYSRCSTTAEKQYINRQVQELKAAGAEHIVVEYEHGDADEKKELSLLLEQVRAGDTIITTEVSRLQGFFLQCVKEGFADSIVVRVSRR